MAIDQHIVYLFECYDVILMEVCGSADAKWPKWEECHSELLLRVWWSSMGWTHRGVGIPGIIGDARWPWRKDGKVGIHFGMAFGNAFWFHFERFWTARTWVHSAHTLALQSCGSGPRWFDWIGNVVHHSWKFMIWILHVCWGSMHCMADLRKSSQP